MKNHHFWAFSRGGTGTKQSGTNTISVLSTGTNTEFFNTGTQFSLLDQKFTQSGAMFKPISGSVLNIE